MVPISKSIYVHTSLEYCQPFLNESTAKFLIQPQKFFSGNVQNCPLPNFQGRFCTKCSNPSKIFLFMHFYCTRKPLHRDGTGGGASEKPERCRLPSGEIRLLPRSSWSRGQRWPAWPRQRGRLRGTPERCCRWWHPQRSCCSAGRPGTQVPARSRCWTRRS